MEAPPVENCQPATNSSEDAAPQDQNNDVPELSDANGARESEHKLSAAEVKSVLEIIASTGKFWHDWNELKSMLAFQLKQVMVRFFQNTQRPQRMTINKIHLWERVLQSWQKDWTKFCAAL